MIIHDVEQGTDEWYALRAGIPSASEFGKLITSKGEPSKSMPDYAIDLANEAYAGASVDAWEGNSFTDRGKGIEADAIALYELAKDVDVERIGFVTNDEKTWGCSPDGFVGDDGLVEVKSLKGTNHTKAIIRYQKDGTFDPKYIPQCQGQMLICERKWLDIFFYHPELPPLIIRQTANAEFALKLNERLEAVCVERDKVLKALKKGCKK